MNDIYELADELAVEIEESGKTRWSAKDVKEFFLSEGVNLSLDEIMQIWKACPSPVCASKLLGCDQVIEASDGLYDDFGSSFASSCTFNFVVMFNYSDDIWDIVENVVNNVFLANNCDVVDFDLYENNDPDPKYAEFELIGANVSYTCDDMCDCDKLVRDLKRTMQGEGYLVIGRPDFL